MKWEKPRKPLDIKPGDPIKATTFTTDTETREVVCFSTTTLKRCLQTDEFETVVSDYRQMLAGLNKKLDRVNGGFVK